MKQLARDLAVLGGAPAFPDTVHVGRPNIGNRNRLLQRINEIVDRRWLTNAGPCLEEFEAKLRKFIGASYCDCLCNATDGLQLAMRALNFSGEVIVPSFTFIATAHAVKWLSMTPVFCDIDPQTHTIDPERIPELITPRTSGIIAVHLWGRPCQIAELESVAQRHGLKLIFDSAHAFGCSHEGRMIGNFGDAEVFSFHATKFFNTAEGGAIAINDKVLAERIRFMRNFGFCAMDQTAALGSNAKMSELSAAMGLTNLESLQEFVDTNLKNYKAYEQGLEGIPGVTLKKYEGADRFNYQYIVLEIDAAEAGLERDEIQKILWAENVLARRYFYPGCHRMEPYASTMSDISDRLPVTERVARRVLVLPTGTAVSEVDVALICGIIRTAVIESAALIDRLRSPQATPLRAS